MTDDLLLSLTNRSVPRYTSYPTAPHFAPAVTSATCREWLSDIPDETALSLYFHVPFCRQLCAYCGCTTKATLKDEPIVAYIDMLRRELAMVARIVGPRHVNHIHWGGGTPNLVPTDLFAEVVDDIDRYFTIVDGAEHAIEIDPRSFSMADAHAFARSGVNRASLGVQDFDARVQDVIGRVQPFGIVEAAVTALREAGITAINFDLIYGLPDQTQDSIRQTAKLTGDLAPSRIALFGYAHVPWFKGHQRLIEEGRLPDQTQRLELARAAREVIDSYGYDSIGIDHFARPEDDLAVAARTGQLHRNFQGYTTDDASALIGLGASSIGKLPQGYVQNVPDVGNWSRAIADGVLATHRGKELSLDDRFRAAIIERILCDFSADLAAICRAHAMLPSVLNRAREALKPFIDSGFVVWNDQQRLAITEHQPQLARVVAAAFDSYLGEGGRHSIAV